jgi:hypothetical protein
MKQKPSPRRKRSRAKSVLRVPDLEHAKAAVLNGLNSTDAKRESRRISAPEQTRYTTYDLALPHRGPHARFRHCGEPGVRTRMRSASREEATEADAFHVGSDPREPANSPEYLFHGSRIFAFFI